MEYNDHEKSWILHMRAFCYSVRDMNYRQMRAYALYGISNRNRQQSMESIFRFITAICRVNVQSLVKGL